ncbi:MAG: Uma2 family endonuclease [Gemmatimonadota bacterium]|nr:Uma2 family endonuclease [Gemmatimonadota bacterium]
MLSPNPAVKFTYEDYQHTPEDKRYELLDGELILVPVPNLEHQRIGIRLGALLHGFVQERSLGEVFHAPCDVVLSNTDVVQPDLLFVSNERAHLLLGGDNVRGAPDLVVEIFSPSTAGRDRTLKRALYAKYGVKKYWLVDPDAWTVTVLRLGEDAFEVEAIYGEGQTMTSPTLAGFSVGLKEIF